MDSTVPPVPRNQVPPQDDGGTSRPRWVLPILLAAIPSVLVASALGRGLTLYGSDWVVDFYYTFSYVGQCFREGRLPMWDSHTMAGFPLAAAMQAAVFYPFTWLTALVPAWLFWPLAAAGHLALGGLFAFVWLRKGLRAGSGAAFLGGVVYMLCGPPLTLLYAGHVSYLFAYAWLPAVVWRADRLIGGPSLRRWLLLALVLGMLHLTGAPQYTFFALLLVAARLLQKLFSGTPNAPQRWTLIGAVATSLVWGTLLAAPQLLTAFELLPHSLRLEGNGYEFVTSYSLAPETLATLVAPHGFARPTGTGSGVLYEALGSTPYVGLATLALAAFALSGRGSRPQRFWGAVVVASVVLALGRHTPLYRVVYHAIPGGSLFRAPERFLALSSLAILPLLARGVDRLLAPEDSDRRPLSRIGIGLGILAAVLAAVLLGGGPRGLFIPLLWSAALAVALVATAWSRLPARTSGLLIGGILAADLLTFGAPYFRGYEVSRLEWPASFVGYVKKHPAFPFRIVSPGNPHAADFGRSRLSGLDHLGGYETLLLARYVELMNAVHERPTDGIVVYVSPGRPHPVLDMLGVRLWLVTPPATPSPEWTPVGQLGAAGIFESQRALPRAFLVGGTKVIPDKESRLSFLAGESFDPTRLVVLEEGLSLPPPEKPFPGRVHLRAMDHDRLAFDVDADHEGFLVLTEAYFPGWNATIDGRSEPVLRANHLVQAVKIGAGKQLVEFTYRSRFLTLGLVLSGVVLGLSVAGLAWSSRRPHR